MTLGGVVVGSGALRQPEQSHARGFETQDLHNLISVARLSPPLKAAASQVRFSPDGKYLLVQVESGVYILDRHPLEVRAWIEAPGALLARFSSDSKTLVLATRELDITRWDLSTNKVSNGRSLGADTGCLTSELSANGSLAACLDPRLVLKVFRTDTDDEIVSVPSDGADSASYVGLIPLSQETGYAEPFGYLVSDTLEPLAGRGIFPARLLFSPGGHFLVAVESSRAPVCLDLVETRRVGCPAEIRKHPELTRGFVSPDEIAVADSDKRGRVQILAFPGGHRESTLGLTAPTAVLTTQPGYLVVRGTGNDREAALFDLRADAELRTTDQGTEMDLAGGTLATYSRDGELDLLDVKSGVREGKIALPAPWLPALRAAIASPNLDSIAVGIRGDGGLFRTATGDRVASLTGLRGGWFAENGKSYAGQYDGRTVSVLQPDPATGRSGRLWSQTVSSNTQFTIQDAHFSGPALLIFERSALYVTPSGVPFSPGYQRRGKLRALDVQTGGQLWSIDWQDDLPVPYADPQGKRLALGWRAESNGGKALAKRYPALRKQMEAVKLTLNDAVFEVLESATGKTVGVVLVRSGWGPGSFDSVYAAGDYLVCVQNGARITTYSLQTGEVQIRVFGYHPSVSGAAGLLAGAEGNRVRLYSLKDARLRGEYLFPNAPVYMRFSADGSRLLVLTVQQFLYNVSVARPALRRCPP